MPAQYPTWTDATLRSDWGAKPKRYRNVRGAIVIEVEGATHRGCEPFSGVLELVAPAKDPRQFQGKLSAEVYCAWHGVKPVTCYPHIHIVGKYKGHRGYTGKVIDNLA